MSTPMTAPVTRAPAAATGPTVVAPVTTTGPVRDAAADPGFRSLRPADRAMRRLLGVRAVDRKAGSGAHRAFRISVMVSAVRCLITYLAIPILVPLLSLSGWVAAPVGIALCVVAVVNGVVSVRRFWASDHAKRWMYTGFMAVVFAILAVAMVSEFHRLGVI
ncbi:hypothetical protein BXY47_0553 [Dietzia kunjamensis]|uniref:hypothetical protein n=2 Tax=Dietzia kunjamensis TaxID=322509 RepID=UPI000FED8AFC|nr:hypothetical protein [Dietzia kunjamensis]RKE66580.1 hypothetical protein BXY47_0553 [Dietzia kunjamensis]